MKSFHLANRLPWTVALFVVSTFRSQAAPPVARSVDLTGAGTIPFNVQFTQDLEICAVVGTNGTVESRETRTGAILHGFRPTPVQFEGQPAPIVFAFNPGSDHLLVGHGTELTLHDPRTGAVVRHFQPPAHPISSLQISPDGHHALATLGQLQVKGLAFWNVTTGAMVTNRPAEMPPGACNVRLQPSPTMPKAPVPEWIEAAGVNAFSPSGKRLFTVLQVTGVDLWDLDQGQCLGTWSPGPFRAHPRAAVALDDHRVAVAVNDHELRVIDPIANTRTIWIAGNPVPGPTALEIRDIALSADGRRLALAGMRMHSRAGFMAAAGDRVFDVPGHGEVQIWDVTTARLLTTFKGRPHEKFVRVALNPSGSRAAAVHNGVFIKPSWTAAMQQSGAFRPTEPLRVTLWDVPGKE